MSNEIDKPNSSRDLANSGMNNVSDITYELLQDAQEHLPSDRTVKVPIAELDSLGAGITSILPSVRTISQTSTVNADGLYRIANAAEGDVLKIAKDGNAWGALKTAEGKSKMAKLAAADPLTAKVTTVAPINPATLMMAGALIAIDKKLDDISETTKEILDFLNVEKHSEIKADVETLMNMIERYKTNWNNPQFRNSNHKETIDIQNKALKNMNFYSEKVKKLLNEKQLIVGQAMVSQKLNDFIKEFKYYRLSLYAYSLASTLEVMLSGNFSEENLTERKRELGKYAYQYRELYAKGSEYLERMTKKSVETNFLKNVGNASNSVGKFIGSIPLVKDGPVDEFLQDSGHKIKKDARGIENKTIHTFAKMSDPKTSIFTNGLNTMIRIYDHTSEICMDKDNVYLISDSSY